MFGSMQAFAAARKFCCWHPLPRSHTACQVRGFPDAEEKMTRNGGERQAQLIVLAYSAARRPRERDHPPAGERLVERKIVGAARFNTVGRVPIRTSSSHV